MTGDTMHSLAAFSFVRLSALRWLAAALAAGLLMARPASAEERSWWQRVTGDSVVGSGKVASETRPIGSFQAIELTGSMKLVVRQAAKESLEARADDNLLPLIDTAIVDHAGVPTLEISTRRGASFSTRSPMVVTVDVVTLTALTLSGSGDAVADDLKTGELQVRVVGSGDLQMRQLAADTLMIKVSGSGDVAATGRAGTLGVSIAGSGDVTARGLEADDVRVSIAGSGDASVNARKALAVSIAGSGDVDHVGDAAVKTSIAGSGSVKKR